jgi:hypothetical protein
LGALDGASGMTVKAHQDSVIRQHSANALRRVVDAVRASWPAGAAGRVLLGLLIAGTALRVLATISLWPTTILEDGYQNFANANPFLDPQHPAGSALILRALGAVTREIAVIVSLQHLIGVASALLLGAGVRRITGSTWAGLLPAAIILIDPDEVFLEHSIMSESWEVLATSVGLYAAVRAFDGPDSWRVWPVLTGLALGIAATIRTAALPIVGVTALALLVGERGTRKRWRAPIVVAGTAAIVLLAFAGANAKFGDRFGIAPSPGWYLYGRVAQFADCNRFTPPPGTAALCQRTPVSKRQSGYYYMFDPKAPATRLFGTFGTFGKDDSLIGGWAKRALQAQFGDFLSTAWSYLRSYYVPSSRPARLKSSTGLDPQLDFTYAGNVFYVAAGLDALKAFFKPFSLHRLGWGLSVLREWQLVVRFGATALFLTTILTLIGPVIGPRRSRVGVILFGLGGLSLIGAPALTGTYSGRHTVTMAGLLMAAAAITITASWRAYGRTKPPTRAPCSRPTA